MTKMPQKKKRSPSSKAGEAGTRTTVKKSGNERAGYKRRIVLRRDATNEEITQALKSVKPGTFVPFARRMDLPDITPMRLGEYQRHNLIVLLQAIAESGVGHPINSGDWASGSVDMALDQLISEEEIAAYQASGEAWPAWMRKHIRGNATVDEVVEWFRERATPITRQND